MGQSLFSITILLEINQQKMIPKDTCKKIADNF